jgi:hypothetical protein
MRFILRKFVDANTVKEAVAMDRKTPVHDCYLKEGEEPDKSSPPKDLMGFIHPDEPSFGFSDEPMAKKR